MGASVIRVVAEHCFARFQRRAFSALDLVQQVHHRLTHGAQMHGDMGSIGNQCPVVVEQRTGKVQPLADIHRAARLPKPLPHLLSNHHEAVMKQAQVHRIWNINKLIPS